MVQNSLRKEISKLHFSGRLHCNLSDSTISNYFCWETFKSLLCNRYFEEQRYNLNKPLLLQAWQETFCTKGNTLSLQVVRERNHSWVKVEKPKVDSFFLQKRGNAALKRNIVQNEYLQTFLVGWKIDVLAWYENWQWR